MSIPPCTALVNPVGDKMDWQRDGQAVQQDGL